MHLQKRTAIWAVLGFSSLLSACGGGGDSSPNVTAAPSATTNLASCISATDGNGFTRSVTSVDILSGQESTSSETVDYSSGLLDGDAVTVMTYSWDASQEKKVSYEKYTDQKYVLLASENGTVKYQGFSIDLTKKVGESQTFIYQVTEGGVTGKPKTMSLKFEGQEALALAGKTLNTCRLAMSVDSGDMEFNDSDSRQGTTTLTWWVAPGYGFMPLKQEGTVTFTDGGQPATAPLSSVLTSYSVAHTASNRATALQVDAARKRHFLF